MFLVMAFFAVLGLSYVNGSWMLKRLRSHHSEAWGSLGEPSLSQSNLSQPRLALLRFVWSMRFRSLNDASLSMHGFIAMVLEIVLVVLFIGLLVVEKSHGA